MSEALTASTVTMKGHGGDEIEAYLAVPDDGATARGGVVVLHHMPDERLIGDVAGAADYLRALSGTNGKVGVIGYCSGGRQAFLAACSVPLDAAVDCYGAFIVSPVPEGVPLKVRPIVGLVGQLSCPLLGLFGADDKNPTPAETAELSTALEEAGKPHEFHTYDGAGHAFFAVDRVAYRPEAANDGWQKIWTFYGRYLAS